MSTKFIFVDMHLIVCCEISQLNIVISGEKIWNGF